MPAVTVTGAMFSLPAQTSAYEEFVQTRINMRRRSGDSRHGEQHAFSVKQLVDRRNLTILMLGDAAREGPVRTTSIAAVSSECLTWLAR